MDSLLFNKEPYRQGHQRLPVPTALIKYHYAGAMCAHKGPCVRRKSQGIPGQAKVPIAGLPTDARGAPSKSSQVGTSGRQGRSDVARTMSNRCHAP